MIESVYARWRSSNASLSDPDFLFVPAILTGGAAFVAMDKGYDFFHATYGWQGKLKSPYEIWKQAQYNKYLNFKLGSKSVARSFSLGNIIRGVGYAHLAWSAGNIAYAGYRGGSQGARDETWNQANSWSFGLLNYWRHKNTTYGGTVEPYYWD